MNWFPTASQYELNLDWILSQVKRFAKISSEMSSSVEDIQHAVETADEAQQTANEAMELISQVVQASPSNTDPVMDGQAAPGTATTYARGDHVHPTDTSRASANNLEVVRGWAVELRRMITDTALADADVLQTGIPQVYPIDEDTLHSPARDNVTLAEEGVLIGFSASNVYAVELALMAGSIVPYIRVKNGSTTWTTWQPLGGV